MPIRPIASTESIFVVVLAGGATTAGTCVGNRRWYVKLLYYAGILFPRRVVPAKSLPYLSAEHRQIEWGPQLEHELREILRLAISEDFGRGLDMTSVPLVPRTALATANVVARQDGVIAGLAVGAVLANEMDSTIKWSPSCEDGESVPKGGVVGQLSGPALDILAAERILLNCLGHLSGIATLTRLFVDRIADTSVKICDTRKTLPGWRLLEKFAVKCGGGTNHRLGLFDAILIKDNHLACGRQASEGFTIAEAIRAARAFAETVSDEIIVQIEVDSLPQLQQALSAEPDMVLLDNMSIEQLAAAVDVRDRLAPRVMLEASGGVTLDSVRAIAETGVDRISVGALTHSAAQLDLGLDWS